MSRKRLILLLIIFWLVLYGNKNMDMVLFYGQNRIKEEVQMPKFKPICVRAVATSNITLTGGDPCEDSQ